MNSGRKLLAMLKRVGGLRRFHMLAAVLCGWLCAAMFVVAAAMLVAWLGMIANVLLAGILAGGVIHVVVVWRDQKYRLRGCARFVEEKMGLQNNELINAVDLHEVKNEDVSDSLREMAVAKADQLSVGVVTRDIVDNKGVVWKVAVTMTAGVLLAGLHVTSGVDGRANLEVLNSPAQPSSDDGGVEKKDHDGVMMLDGELVIEYQRGDEVVRETQLFTGGDVALPAGAKVALTVRCDRALHEAKMMLSEGDKQYSVGLTPVEGEAGVVQGSFELEAESRYSLVVSAGGGEESEVLIAGRLMVTKDSGDSSGGGGRGEDIGEGRIAMGHRQRLSVQPIEVAEGQLMEVVDESGAKKNEQVIVDYDALPLKYRRAVAEYFKMLAEDGE